IHVPLQSSEIKKPREALLSPGATGNGCRAKHLHVDRQFGQNKLCLTTTYCGYLSQMDTHFMQIDGGVGGYLCLSSTKIILYPLATLNFQSNIPSGSGLSAFNFRSVVDRVFSSLLPYLIASSFRGLSS